MQSDQPSRSRWCAFWDQPAKINVRQAFILYTVSFILGAVAWATKEWLS